jgi:hypothetical protein
MVNSNIASQSNLILELYLKQTLLILNETRFIFIITTNLCFQIHRAFECFKQPDTIPAGADVFVTHLHPGLYSNSKFNQI